MVICTLVRSGCMIKIYGYRTEILSDIEKDYWCDSVSRSLRVLGSEKYSSFVPNLCHISLSETSGCLVFYMQYVKSGTLFSTDSTFYCLNVNISKNDLRVIAFEDDGGSGLDEVDVQDIIERLFWYLEKVDYPIGRFDYYVPYGSFRGDNFKFINSNERSKNYRVTDILVSMPLRLYG